MPNACACAFRWARPSRCTIGRLPWLLPSELRYYAMLNVGPTSSVNTSPRIINSFDKTFKLDFLVKKPPGLYCLSKVPGRLSTGLDVVFGEIEYRQCFITGDDWKLRNALCAPVLCHLAASCRGSTDTRLLFRIWLPLQVACCYPTQSKNGQQTGGYYSY